MAIDKSKVKNIIVKRLIADSNITDEVANRIYPSHLATIESPVFPCICFDFAGSGDKDMSALPNALSQTMNMWFYGQERKGYVLPHKLLRFTYDSIHRQGLQDTTLGINLMCEQVSEPLEFVDPEKNIPYTYNRWQVSAFS